MALIIHPNGVELEVQPKNGTDFTLEEVKAVVEGYIEVGTLEDGRIMLLNEEGKLEGLAYNAKATTLYLKGRVPDDFIVGSVLVCENGEFR